MGWFIDYYSIYKDKWDNLIRKYAKENNNRFNLLINKLDKDNYWNFLKEIENQ